MAIEETKEIKKAQLKASKHGGRLYRNNRGVFYTESGMKTRAGLEQDGASDLIGHYPLEITQDMVGKTIAVFWAAEGKRKGWKGVKTETERKQQIFIDNINNRGGIGFFFDDGEKIIELVEKRIDELKRIV